MSHQFESGAFSVNPAWHKLGIVYQEPITLERARQDTAPWEIEQVPLFAPLSVDQPVSGPQIQVPGWKAIWRDDKLGEAEGLLHVCRNSYTPLTNAQTFDFFAPFFQDQDVAVEATCCLNGGKLITVLVRVLVEGDVVPGDTVYPYILLFNSHDGSTSVGVKMTMVRVVCRNTFEAAFFDSKAKRELGLGMYGNDREIRMRHTANIQKQLEQVRNSINLSKRVFDLSMLEYQHMAAKQFNTALFRTYLENLFEKELQASSEPKQLEDLRAFEPILENYEGGIGVDIPGVAGTAWAAYQAVSEYVSHQRIKSEDNRLKSLHFGSSRRILAKAHELALAL